MKKILFIVALTLTCIFILTGCDFGAANDDYNIHIKDNPVEVVVVNQETKGEYKEVDKLYAYCSTFKVLASLL